MLRTNIKVELLFFGMLRSLVGSGTMSMTIIDPSSVSDVMSKLKELHPELSKLRLLHSVNEAYTDDTAVLNDGDRLAVFTAVSGG